MRVLVVGFADSVHLTGFLRTFEGTAWDARLFNSTIWGPPHPELPDLPVYTGVRDVAAVASGRPAQIRQLPTPRSFAEHADRLAEVIDEFRPDIVHSHEIQHAGALVHQALKRPPAVRPAWLCTNWGSDIFWFGRSRLSRPTIRAVVGACDYYSAECHRDVALARAFGLRGKVVGVWPATAGIDLPHVEKLRVPGPTSARRTIAVKGVTGSYGQGHRAFQAIARCADLLAGWEICTYSADAAVARRYDDLATRHPLRHTSVSTADRPTGHEDHMAMHGRSRVSIGFNRSDALSMSFVEALAMGSFPVQSSSSCGHEVTTPGRGALFVSPSDVDALVSALRRALTDDALVDSAAKLNQTVCRTWFDVHQVRLRVIDAYERILDDSRLHSIGV
jgi:glycosyl transferase family 4